MNQAARVGGFNYWSRHTLIVLGFDKQNRNPGRACVNHLVTIKQTIVITEYTLTEQRHQLHIRVGQLQSVRQVTL